MLLRFGLNLWLRVRGWGGTRLNRTPLYAVSYSLCRSLLSPGYISNANNLLPHRTLFDGLMTIKNQFFFNNISANFPLSLSLSLSLSRSDSKMPYYHNFC